MNDSNQEKGLKTKEDVLKDFKNILSKKAYNIIEKRLPELPTPEQVEQSITNVIMELVFKQGATLENLETFLVSKQEPKKKQETKKTKNKQ